MSGDSQPLLGPPSKMEEQQSLTKTTRDVWDSLDVWGPLLLVVTLSFIVAYLFFVPPPPPKNFKIATGDPDGAYFSFARDYANFLATQGFNLEVIPTKGSVHNLQLLREGKVDLAFVQGGTTQKSDEALLEAVASLYFEPLWIFHRGAGPFQTLQALRGKTMAIGSEGSGTRAVSIQLLKDNGIVLDPKLHLEIGGIEAVQQLEKGLIDCIFLVASGRSKLAHRLLETKGIHLLNFRRYAAYEHRHRFLSSVVLSEGSCNLQRNIPPHDTRLLAPTANLVIRKKANRALIPLILNAAIESHEIGDLFEKKGQFPSLSHMELPLAKVAKNYLGRGPSLLQRILPISLALTLERLKIMLVPLFTLLLPLLKIAPPVYRWRIRHKIYRWYRILRALDQEIMEDLIEDGRIKNADGYFSRLITLRHELDKVSVPLSYMEEFYNLRLHITLVTEFVEKKLADNDQAELSTTPTKAVEPTPNKDSAEVGSPPVKAPEQT